MSDEKQNTISHPINESETTDPSQAKAKKLNGTDHSEFERSTPSQEMFQEALFARLRLEGMIAAVFVNARMAMRTKTKRRRGHCVRAGDILMIRPGLVIEIDGSAHDRVDKRCRRDNTREHDWHGLGFQVMRISDTDVYDSVRLARFLDGVIALIREAEAHPDHAKIYHRRRQRIFRARQAYQKQNPEYNFGIAAWPERRRPRRQASTTPRPHARREGAVYFIGRKSRPSKG